MQLTLVNGKTVTLALPDLYQLVAADPIDKSAIDIPNEALTALVDLIVYGAVITMPESDAARLKENRRFMLARWEVARLCCEAPPLVLRGTVPDGALTPRDIHPRDLNAIMDFFQSGGSDGVSAAPGAEPGADTPADQPRPTVE